jgi:hypothetical protein
MGAYPARRSFKRRAIIGLSVIVEIGGVGVDGDGVDGGEGFGLSHGNPSSAILALMKFDLQLSCNHSPL